MSEVSPESLLYFFFLSLYPSHTISLLLDHNNISNIHSSSLLLFFGSIPIPPFDPDRYIHSPSLIFLDVPHMFSFFPDKCLHWTFMIHNHVTHQVTYTTDDDLPTGTMGARWRVEWSYFWLRIYPRTRAGVNSVLAFPCALPWTHTSWGKTCK